MNGSEPQWTCYAARMATVTFDTHKYVRRLREAGFDDRQAEALTDAMQSAIGEIELVTRTDLQLELAPIRTDLAVIKWMLGVLLAGVVALVLKGFF